MGADFVLDERSVNLLILLFFLIFLERIRMFSEHANGFLYRTSHERDMEYGFFHNPNLERNVMVSVRIMNVFRNAQRNGVRIQVFGELHLERHFVPSGYQDFLLRRQAFHGNRLEHRLILRANLERLPLVAGGLRNRI